MTSAKLYNSQIVAIAMITFVSYFLLSDYMIAAYLQNKELLYFFIALGAVHVIISILISLIIYAEKKWLFSTVFIAPFVAISLKVALYWNGLTSIPQL